MSLNMDELGSTLSVKLQNVDYSKTSSKVTSSKIDEETSAENKSSSTEELKLSEKYKNTSDKHIELEQKQQEVTEKAITSQDFSKIEEKLKAIKDAASDGKLSDVDYEKVKNDNLDSINKINKDNPNTNLDNTAINKDDNRDSVIEKATKSIEEVEQSQKKLTEQINDNTKLASNYVVLPAGPETKDAPPVETQVEQVKQDIIKDPQKAVDIQINSMDASLLLAMTCITSH